MALVPWPENPNERHQAEQSVAHVVFGDPNSSDNRARAVRLGPVASLMVGRYAPEAPDEIQDEAVYRVVAWLNEKRLPYATMKAGSVELRARRRQRNALRATGSASLLNPWRVRRAGKVSA